MASSGNVTVTAPVGPGKTATALLISNILEITYDIPRDVIFIKEQNGKVHEFDYSTVATVTHVIAAGVATITIST